LITSLWSEPGRHSSCDSFNGSVDPSRWGTVPDDEPKLPTLIKLACLSFSLLGCELDQGWCRQEEEIKSLLYIIFYLISSRPPRREVFEWVLWASLCLFLILISRLAHKPTLDLAGTHDMKENAGNSPEHKVLPFNLLEGLRTMRVKPWARKHSLSPTSLPGSLVLSCGTKDYLFNKDKFHTKT
jgi:hypothetical protein